MKGTLQKAGANWVDGDRFFDREVELKLLCERVRNGTHTLLTAQRRMGKTSLVRELLRRLDAQGEFETVFVDLEGAASAADAIAEIATQARSVQGLGQTFSDKFGNVLEGVSEVLILYYCIGKTPTPYTCIDMTRERYASALSDAQWARWAPLLPAAKPGGRPRTVDLREVVQGILYVLRSGCAWRLVPGAARSAPWADPVQILPPLDAGWHRGTGTGLPAAGGARGRGPPPDPQRRHYR